VALAGKIQPGGSLISGTVTENSVKQQRASLAGGVGGVSGVALSNLTNLALGVGLIVAVAVGIVVGAVVYVAAARLDYPPE